MLCQKGKTMVTITLIKLLFIETIQSLDVEEDVTFDGRWSANLCGPHNRGYTVVSSSEDECGRARAVIYLGMYVLKEALEIQHKSTKLKGLIRDVVDSVATDAQLHNISLGALERYKQMYRPATVLPPSVNVFA